MKLRLLAATAVAGAIAVSAAAQDPWLHIYRTDTRFHTVPLDSVASLTIAPDAGTDAASELILNLVGSGHVLVPVKAFDHVAVSPTVPSFYITTADPSFKDVADKTTEWDATLRVESNGYPGMEDVDGQELKLRGRGNSTLGMPKKPYRLKAKKKFALHSDLRSAKNYVLLANYIDNSLMRNTVAFKTAQLLDLPYTPHGVPCNVWINDIYRGSYLLCEKTGLNSGNIHDIEETEGILLELDTNIDPSDTYFEDEYGVKEIGPFRFPVAIKDPDFKELEEDGEIESAKDAIEAWQNKYMELVNTLNGSTGKDWADLVDLESAVRYVMTFHFCGNLELRHPKSCFMRARSLDSKFEFGPIWDFDWAFTYGDAGEGTQAPNVMPFGGENAYLRGASFFRPMITDERFQKRFGEVWEEFRAEKLPELLEYFDKYADAVEPSAALNGQLWPYGSTSSSDFRGAASRLRQWLQWRANFISTAPNFGLYEGDYEQNIDTVPEGFTQVALTPDMLTPSDPDPTEGPVADLVDGDVATYYHSDYHSFERHDATYGSYIDIALPEEATSIVVDMITRIHPTPVGAPSTFSLYLSDNGADWTFLTSARDLVKTVFEKPGSGARFGAYSSVTPFKFVRLAVTESGNGDLRHNKMPDDIPDEIKPWVESLYRTYWNLAELRIYTNIAHTNN